MDKNNIIELDGREINSDRLIKLLQTGVIYKLRSEYK